MELAQDLPEQLQRIRVECLGNGYELGHVDLALVAFDHSDDRMRPLEPRCELALRNLPLPSSASEHIRDCAGGGTSKGLHDTCAPIN